MRALQKRLDAIQTEKQSLITNITTISNQDRKEQETELPALEAQLQQINQTVTAIQ
jgi:hypothetical protein